MNRSSITLQLRRLLALVFFLAPFSASAQQVHRFTVQDGHFALDGKPFQIISGEMHYPRIPRAYWRDRLRLAKAMGLNTITTYTFWNLHEPEPGQYDFSGNNDVAEFIREAQQEGLYVILRPGPYVCAEWEWGGYPAWLLRTPGIVVRSRDPQFMKPARTWLNRLGKELSDLQIDRGGPIIAIQVENEYGSFGKDHDYVEDIHKADLDAGFNGALLYTADGGIQIPDGSLPELPAVVNFGTGEAKASFELLRKYRPTGPFMAGEYWAGWFDHWGETHQTPDAAVQEREIDWILRQGYSLSLYMFHGGTSFGWMNGANYDRHYKPDVTSYDYDAALDESGRPTAKFYKLREIISAATGKTPPPVPEIAPTGTIPSFTFANATSLWKYLPAPTLSDQPLTMEQLKQSYGYVLYRTHLVEDGYGDLVISGLHDYAQIYADGVLLGVLDRRLEQSRLSLTLKAGTQLDILVENSGRINFKPILREERKGILGKVTLAGVLLSHWENYSLPMKSPESLSFSTASCSGACFYRGSFQIKTAQDSFLDTSGFFKGFVWINGRPLGRIWSIGPQKTLYLPKPWIHKGTNQVIVFDLQGKANPQMSGLSHPILNAPVSSSASKN